MQSEQQNTDTLSAKSAEHRMHPSIHLHVLALSLKVRTVILQGNLGLHPNRVKMQPKWVHEARAVSQQQRMTEERSGGLVKLEVSQYPQMTLREGDYLSSAVSLQLINSLRITVLDQCRSRIPLTEKVIFTK